MPPKTEHSRALTRERPHHQPHYQVELLPSSGQNQRQHFSSILSNFTSLLNSLCPLTHISVSPPLHTTHISLLLRNDPHMDAGQQGCSPFHLLTLTSLQKTQGRGKSSSHPPLHLSSWLQLLQSDHSPAFRALYFKSWWPWDKALWVDRGLGTCSPARHQSAEADSVWGRAGALPASWHINIQQAQLRAQEAEAQRIMSKHPWLAEADPPARITLHSTPCEWYQSNAIVIKWEFLCEFQMNLCNIFISPQYTSFFTSLELLVINCSNWIVIKYELNFDFLINCSKAITCIFQYKLIAVLLGIQTSYFYWIATNYNEYMTWAEKMVSHQ